jgi:hypothetical protein
VLAVAAQLAALVTVTVYVPLAAVVAAAMLGVALVELNPFGPAQLYVPPPVAVKFRLVPTHIGLLLLAVATGKALIVTVVEVVAVQPLEVTVTLYVPLDVAVTLATLVAPEMEPPPDADHA